MTAGARQTRLGVALSVALTLAGPAVGEPPPAGREIVPLYAAGASTPLGVPERRQVRAPGDTLIFNVSEPALEVYRPAGRPNGTAMIIAPGGGFVALEYEAGGTDVALRLAQQGVTAFVLKYRTIRSAGELGQLPPVHRREMDAIMARAKTGRPHEVPPFAGEPHAVADGARALRLVRSRAAEWGVDPHRVGVLGFSAGAYLAADLAIGVRASRPNFVALLYGGLRTPVPADAPPAFIAAAADDAFQPNDAALLFAAWCRAGAPAELHVYEHGGHGFTFEARGATSDHWFEELIWWMRSRGLVT